ncbi:ketosteroid isomerase-like protein [Amaricoccus macauensis]|uniref:Ketosteroid isomerase-like protein n=1 Tax=Amaricoccus macauensis TaxID=57001 RepID=A0A840SME6_9RHOB|nr:DUF4440 domain-containing protein [Amaricoccus macauensis]MBB5221428.1 ketosteroid isomerase-like protein [Amaricoccus macauensis]
MSDPAAKASEADARAIQAVFAAIAHGFRDRDAAVIARHYARDAIVADLAPPLQRQGVEPGPLQEWLDGWDGPVILTHKDILVDLSGDQAVCHGLVHTEVLRGGEAIGWWARATTVLRRADDGQWMVTLEHVSVPFHTDGSFRAALDLKP